MFTSVELDYLKGLINTYAKQGYKYYVAHTITEINNDYDFCVYFSKEEITASNSNNFVIPSNSYVVYVDSSSRNDNSYNPSTGSRDTVSLYEGDLRVNVAEFIYTNASLGYNVIDYPINPDLNYAGTTSLDTHLVNYSLLFICSSIFIYMFIKSILRIRR